jgi:hypothetical protein|tara:strand:+ start:413 stop:892 length:480 start_codon:yes stop_codon:yes gene_type:complete
VAGFGTTLFAATAAGREGVLTAASGVSDPQLIAFHILRLLAIGTIVKYLQRQLPLHFVIFGSLPDVLFAGSAAVMTVLAATAPASRELLFAWHSLGFAVFFGAGISMFLSVPSPLRLFNSRPDASLVFRFPIVLAPNFTVPLFMLAHLFAIAKIVAVRL